MSSRKPHIVDIDVDEEGDRAVVSAESLDGSINLAMSAHVDALEDVEGLTELAADAAEAAAECAERSGQ